MNRRARNGAPDPDVLRQTQGAAAPIDRDHRSRASAGANAARSAARWSPLILLPYANTSSPEVRRADLSAVVSIAILKRRTAVTVGEVVAAQLPSGCGRWSHLTFQVATQTLQMPDGVLLAAL